MEIPADSYEDRIEIDLARVETVPSTLGEASRLAYPYPVLRLGEGSETRVWQSVVLENAFLKATFLPDFGGRLFSLFDKRTQRETFPMAPISVGGPRGIEWRQGLRWRGGANPLNDLGPVDFQLLEPDEDGSATLILGDYAAGDPIGWHVLITLPAERAELRVEMRLYNRKLGYARVEGGFDVDLAATFSSPACKAFEGLAVWSDPGIIDFTQPSVRRFGSNLMGPLTLDAFGFRIAPAAEVGAVLACSPFGTLGFQGSELKFQVQEAAPGTKLIVKLKDGRTLEAGADLSPEHPFTATLDGEVEDFVALGPNRETLFRIEPPYEPGAIQDPIMHVADALSEGTPVDPFLLRLLETEPSTTHTATWARVIGPDPLRALDDYLGKNAEDPRAWILKAIHSRLQGLESEDALNAHYLAPLDPLLRMESWLAQNLQTKEPSPLVAPLAANPDHLVEGAAFLYEVGLFEELARWCDEGLRHREVPMLRYYMAAALIRRERMPVEAAELVLRAGKAPINPPYPWRHTDWSVLNLLAERFPGDARIRDLRESKPKN